MTFVCQGPLGCSWSRLLPRHLVLCHLSGDTRDLETTQPRCGGYNFIDTGSPQLHPSTTETECDGQAGRPSTWEAEPRGAFSAAW